MIEYAQSGDPVKDVIQETQWREHDVLVLLAEHYVATVKPHDSHQS